MLELFLPWPPSTNALWRTGHGRMYRSARYVEWSQRAENAVSATFGGNPISGPVSVEIRLYGPSRRSYDIDNRGKAVLDLMQHAGVIENDDQVEHLVIHRGQRRKGGGCWVIVQRMDHETAPEWPDYAPA